MLELPDTIALHIGAHKTASSHLQSAMNTNVELLSEDGIRYVGPNYLRRNGRNLAAMFRLSWSNAPKPRRGRNRQLQFLAKGHERIVFSEENFAGMMANEQGRLILPLYPHAADRVAEFVKAVAPVRVQLFVGIRNPASYVSSAYSQVLRSMPHIGPRTFRSWNNWRLIDWAEYLERLRAVDGLDKIVVWRQEDYDESPIPVLGTMLGWRTAPQMTLPEARVNQGLSTAAVRLTLQRAMDGEEGRLASQARRALPVDEENPLFQLYAKSTLAKADAIYAAQVARIAAMEGVSLLYHTNVEKGAAGEG